MTKIKISVFEKKEKNHNTFEGYHKESLTPQGKKLLKEWKKIDSLCQKSDRITYIVRKRNREGLPIEYEIIYQLNSIVGIEKQPNGRKKGEADTIPEEKQQPRKPIYSNEHRLSIILPNNYPRAYGGNPEFMMLTDTWHPNIRATGKFKGRICLNNKDLGVNIGLDDRIIRVGKYLQYQIYWANDTYPWPEDKTVAEWVRDEAEPNKWVNIKEGIYTDYSTLHKTEKTVKQGMSNKNGKDEKPESEKDNPVIKI